MGGAFQAAGEACAKALRKEHRVTLEYSYIIARAYFIVFGPS